MDIDTLLRRAPAGSFFAVVGLLERLTSGAVRVGGDGPPAREALRLLHDPSMAFPAGDIRSVTSVAAHSRRGHDQPARYEVLSMMLGLAGSVSPLPLHLSAEIAHEESGAGGSRRAFLDVFHHRLLSLFYRSWTRYQLPQQCAQSLDDVWSQRLYALGGRDPQSRASATLGTADGLALLPILAGRARTAEGLARVLQRMLGASAPAVQVAVQQFTGGAVPIQPRRRMALGRQTAVLGRGAVLGGKARAPANGFRLVIGPLPRRRSAEFVAGGPEHRRIAGVVREFVREPLRYDLCLHFTGGEGEGFALSASDPAPLGRGSFLRGRGGDTRVIVRGSSD